MVSDKGKQPAIAYWCIGVYVRKHKDITGKHVLVYRACKHAKAREPIVKGSVFEKYVKEISIKYQHKSVDALADKLDAKFGTGCHYARSTAKKANYDIYARFSDKYDAGCKLPKSDEFPHGAYVIAWRR